MAKSLTRAQALENRAFLKVLRRTGNIRLAARSVGLKYGTVQHRRRVHPGFAAAVGAAIVYAQAALAKKQAKGPLHRLRRSPSPGNPGEDPRRSCSSPHPPTATLRVPPSPAEGRGAYRTAGGEPIIVRLKSGKLQVRAAQAGKLTVAAEQAFLCALAATCNIALAAAAVGAAPNAFARRRKRNPAFAREILLAIAQGYETLDLALLEGLEPYADADWRGGEPPPMPPMSVDQVLQLMRVHQKEARLLAEVEKWRGVGAPLPARDNARVDPPRRRGEGLI
jgi:hypothetical protein